MKKGQEPAFACECMSANGSDGHLQEGMSKRFYAACAAMQGMLANRGAYYQSVAFNDPFDNLGGELPAYCAKIAYQFADELLKQENEES